MLVVPLAGDVITTSNGLRAKVLAFSNLSSSGPLVLVDKQAAENVVDFRDIVQIGKSKVELLKNDKGFKIFSASGSIKRKYHLPQPGDVIKADPFQVGPSDFVIEKLSLGVRNELSRGLIIDVVGKADGQKAQIGLSQILDIEKTIFSKKDFLSYYTDYRISGT